MRRILSFLSLVLVVFFVFAVVSLAEPSDLNQAVLTTNHDGVRLRDNAGKSNIIAVVKHKGTPLEFIETVYVEEVLWYHVRVDGVDGYIYGEYVNVNYDADPSSVGLASSVSTDPNKTYLVMLGDKLNLRDWPNGKLITTMYGAGTIMEMLKPSQLNREPWYYVRYEDYEGYIYASYVGLYKGDVLTETPTLRMVDSNSSSGIVENVGSIKNVVEATADVVINSDSIKSLSSAETPVVDPVSGAVGADGDVSGVSDSDDMGTVYLLTNATHLNVRRGPSMDFPAITSIAGKGVRLVALNPEEIGASKWYHIQYGDIEGYCSAKYLDVDESSVLPVVSDEPVGSDVAEVEAVDNPVEQLDGEPLIPIEDIGEPVESVIPDEPEEVTYGTVETSVDVEIDDGDVKLHG